MRYDLELRHVILICIFIGIAVGFVAAIPVIWIPNICCLWVVFGGFMAVLVSNRNHGIIEHVDAALVGAVFGLFYAIFNEITHYVLKFLLGALGFTYITLYSGGGIFSSLFVAAIVFAANLVLSVFFGSLGGLIYVSVYGTGHGVAVFKRSDKATLARKWR